MPRSKIQTTLLWSQANLQFILMQSAPASSQRRCFIYGSLTRLYCLCMFEEACYDSQQNLQTRWRWWAIPLTCTDTRCWKKNFIIDYGANVSVVPKPFALEMGIDYRTCSDNWSHTWKWWSELTTPLVIVHNKKTHSPIAFMCSKRGMLLSSAVTFSSSWISASARCSMQKTPSNMIATR